MKLGLVLKITNGGESESFSINKNESWARFAADARSAIKELTNFDETEKTVYLAKFLGAEGYLLCVIKARPEGSGRANDNTAAWIHIPANVIISSEETIEVLNNVEKAISQNKGTDIDLLERLFSHEYDTTNALVPAVGKIASNNDSPYAVRYFNGDYTLNELIGSSIAQKEYAKFKGIIFVNKALGILHASNYELNFEPKKICSYQPIASIDGFKPGFVSNNSFTPFDKAIEVPAGTPIELCWIKNGYMPIQKKFIAEPGLSIPDTAIIRQNEYNVKVPRKLFYVTDNNGAPIAEFNITINSRTMEGDYLPVSEAVFRQGLTVSVSAKGFSDWKKTNYHINLDKVVKIPLTKQIYTYEFALPVYINGKDRKEDAIAKVETHYKLTESPFIGYKPNCSIRSSYVNRLYVDDNMWTKMKYTAYGFLACLLMFLFIAAYNALDNYEFQFGWPPIKETQEVPADTATADTTTSSGEINQEAVDYLEKNNTWKKEELDKFEETKDLFDALNTFNLDQLQTIANRLSTSSKLSQVVNALAEGRNKKWNASIGKEKNSGNYNSPSDNGINIDNYIKWISQDHGATEVNFDDFESTSSEPIHKELKQKETKKDESASQSSKSPQKKASETINHITGKANKTNNTPKTTQGSSTRGEVK